MNPADAWVAEDPTLCPVCGRESCEDHVPPAATKGFPATELDDAVDVARQGREIQQQGIPYLLEALIPAYGMFGFLVAFAKVGKTTLGQQIAAHVAMGRPFLERKTTATRVLVLAAEDPPEYTAWLARHLDVDPGRMVFRRRPLILNPTTLQQICATVHEEHFGAILIASWQAVIRGLIRDENDNAGAVRVVEDVKAASRLSGIPWLTDAHSGKGEDQRDDADPAQAMRGASSAAGAADWTLSLRYANGTFGNQRRLSGKGRFVSFAPLTVAFNPDDSSYSLLGATKDVGGEITWQLLCETGALDATPRSVAAMASIAGMVIDGKRITGATRRRIETALRGRPDVLKTQTLVRGQKTDFFARVDL